MFEEKGCHGEDDGDENLDWPVDAFDLMFEWIPKTCSSCN